jgi:diguanylate cyclase (GGDEF)-like protein
MTRAGPASIGRTRRALVLIACALAALVPQHAFALDPDKAFEHYVSKSWSIQEGLPQISALAIAQDHTGYIWVGTQNGLARFDGVRFTTFTPGSEPALPGIYIRALLVDRDGRVWIGTYKGLAVFERDRFRSIPASDHARYPTLDINALAQTADGRVVAATSGGVFRVDGDHLVEWPQGPRPALSLLPRADGLWVGGNGTVLRLGADKVQEMPLGDRQKAEGVTHLAQAQGRIWAGTTQGLYSRTGDAWVRFEEDAVLARSPVNSILRDRDDNLWVSTNSGFVRLRDGHLAERIDPTSLRAARSVVSSFEDREGNLWLGSQLEGLARVWNGWTRRHGTSTGLNDPIVWSLARAPDGTLWVGGNSGLSTFDGKRFALVVPGSALPNPQAYNLLAEADRIWIGTRHGLAIWHDGKVETPALYAPMASAQINGIRRDRNGDLWFLTTEGLFFQHGPTLRRYGETDGLAEARIRTMLETRAHRVLIGTQSGLFEMHGDRFTPVAGLPPGLDVTTVTELPSGAFVIGVLTESIYVSNGSGWKNIGKEQGLPSDTPFFQTADDRGYLWIGGIRGVERVPVADLERFARGDIRTVRGELLLNERGDRNAGQQGDCCNGAGLSKGFIEGHVLWLPSRDGVVEMDAHGIVKNAVTPAVVIERVHYLDAWHAVGDAAARIELEPRARDVAFDFTALSFQDPPSILMRYRLVGYDRDWHDMEDVTRRSVNYTNLPPGEYTFEVRAANNAGVWSPTTARFAFGIRPWFYETLWFYALLVLLLAALVYAGYRRQRQLHAQQRERLEWQVAERTAELRDEIVERERIQEQLKHQVLHDGLTGLPNRGYLRDRLQRALIHLKRDPGRFCALLFLDVDRFKVINDSLGHLVGDEVLKEVARRLMTCVRGPDLVARLSGDEFAILLEDVPIPATAAKVAQRVLNAFAAPARIDGTDLTLSTSIGVAFGDPRHETADEVLRDADAAMYRAKKGGRGRYEMFDESLQQIAVDVLRLEAELRTALQQDQFEPWFQPIQRLRSGETIGYEALIRWNHPTRGVLGPAQFLKVAEENGSMQAIDWRMFELACGLAARSLAPDTYLAINISPRHFRRAEFGALVLALLERTGLAPRRLLLEITEGSLIEHPEEVRATLEHLRDSGIGAALDDFGTGYSSLSYLHTLPLRTLKIDRAFVAELDKEGKGSTASVVASVLALARALGMNTIAEGIETEAQREALLALGCESGQGYLLGRPAPIGQWNAHEKGSID